MNQLDKKLYDIAKNITNQHLKFLRVQREQQKLFKRVNANGKIYGRSFKFNSNVYKNCIKENITITEIIEKKGDDKKYLYALNKIFFNCFKCKEKSCPYCFFNIKSNINISLNLKLLFSKLNNNWKIFKLENNFAPTKKLLILLSQSKKFLSKLYSTKYFSIDPNLMDNSNIIYHQFLDDQKSLISNTSLNQSLISNTSLNQSLISNTSLNQSLISNTSLNQSFISNISLNQSLISNTSLNQSLISNTSLNQSSISNISLNQSSISNTSLNQSLISNTSLNQSIISNTSLNQSFISNTSLNQSFIPNTSLNQSLIPNTSLNQSLTEIIKLKIEKPSYILRPNKYNLIKIRKDIILYREINYINIIMLIFIYIFFMMISKLCIRKRYI